MGFWVYGNDRQTGARAKFYSDAADEDGARVQASEQGVFVERVEKGVDSPEPEAEWEPEPLAERSIYVREERPARLNASDASPPSSLSFSGIALGVAELLSVLASGGSLFYIAYELAQVGQAPAQAIGYALVGLFSFFYNAALAIVFSFVRRELKARRDASDRRQA